MRLLLSICLAASPAHGSEAVAPVATEPATEAGRLAHIDLPLWVTGPDEGIAFDVVGPRVLMLEIYGRAAAVNRPIPIEVRRDGTHLSTTSVTPRLDPSRPGAGDYVAVASLATAVEEGAHRYRVHSPGRRIGIAASTPVLPPPGYTPFAAELALGTEDAVDDKPAAREASNVPAEPEAVTTENALATEENVVIGEDVVNGGDVASGDPPVTPTEADAVAPQDGAPAAGAGDTSAALANENATPDEAQPPIDLYPGSVGAPPAEPLELRVAVYAMHLEGIEPRIGMVVTDSLLAEVRKMEGVTAIGMDEIADMLSHEANKQLLGCDDESCLAEIAGALGVDDIVTGKLTQVGNGRTMLVRRINQGRAEVVGSVSKRLESGSGEEFLAAVGPVVQELYPSKGLRSGQARGVADEVAMRLSPPPLPKWSFNLVAGGAIASLAIGALYGGLAFDEQSKFNGLGSEPTASGRDLVGHENKAVENQNIANGFFVTAGVLGLSAAVMAFFTDWWDYGEAVASVP